MSGILFGLFLYYVGSRRQEYNHCFYLLRFIILYFIADYFLRPNNVDNEADAKTAAIIFGGNWAVVGFVGLWLVLRCIKLLSSSLQEYKDQRSTLLLFISRLLGAYLAVIGMVRGVLIWITKDAFVAYMITSQFGTLIFLFALFVFWPKKAK